MVDRLHTVSRHPYTKLSPSRNRILWELDHLKGAFIQERTSTSRNRQIADRHFPVFDKVYSSTLWLIVARRNQIGAVLAHLLLTNIIQQGHIAACKIRQTVLDMKCIANCKQLIGIRRRVALDPLVDATCANLYAVVSEKSAELRQRELGLPSGFVDSLTDDILFLFNFCIVQGFFCCGKR